MSERGGRENPVIFLLFFLRIFFSVPLWFNLLLFFVFFVLFVALRGSIFRCRVRQFLEAFAGFAFDELVDARIARLFQTAGRAVE